MTPDNRQLAERYRPTTFADVVGQSAAVKRLQAFADRNQVGGKAFWITGQSGAGKTTLARILASTIADEWAICETDPYALTAERLKEIESESRFYGMVKPGRAFIVNEAHGLRADQVRRLKTIIEPPALPNHVAWIFTTTIEEESKLFDTGEDAAALLSRCQCVQLARRGVCEAIAQRAFEIAQAEGFTEITLQDCIRMAKDERNNMRTILQQIEASDLVAA